MNGLLIVWPQRGALWDGFLTTLAVAVGATLLAVTLGVLLFAPALRFRPAAYGVRALTDGMRCVPFLLFLYLISYGLPAWGIVLDNLVAGVLALTLYNAAYFAELLRGAWAQLPPEQIEAGVSFGLHGVTLLRRVILPPLVFAAIPMLGNQVIQIIKDSAFLVIITVRELTYAVNEIQSTFYVPLASFVCAALLYWVLCLGVETGVRAMLRRAELVR